IRGVWSQVDRHGHGRHRQGVETHFQFVGVHRRRNGTRLLCRGRADGYGICAVPSDRHGVASGSAGHSRHRGGSRRRRNSPQQVGRTLHGKIRSEENGTFHPGCGGRPHLHATPPHTSPPPPPRHSPPPPP